MAYVLQLLFDLLQMLLELRLKECRVSGNILQVLQHGHVGGPQRLLQERLDHVHVLADLVLQRLVYLEEVQLNGVGTLATHLSTLLLLQPTEVPDTEALVYKFHKQYHALHMQHEEVVEVLSLINVSVEADELFAGEDTHLDRVDAAKFLYERLLNCFLASALFNQLLAQLSRLLEVVARLLVGLLELFLDLLLNMYPQHI